MKLFIFVFVLLLNVATAFGQVKDQRARLGICGRVNEISVAPDGAIWLVTATGNMYYTPDIDSNWYDATHCLGFEKDGEDLFSFGVPHLDRISFFNKDTAIMTGYIAALSEDLKNGYYWTQDAGKSWELRKFNGNDWLYDAFVDTKGHAWMGGSSGEIYFSENYGYSFKKLNSPYNSSSRMCSIFMLNEKCGISGALHNAIYYTSNNWKSNKQIATPLDQKKYSRMEFWEDRIAKIRLWNNLMVVEQSGHIFYSKIDSVNWQPFPVKIIDFELDKESDRLFAVTDSLKVVSFSSPTEYNYLSDNKLDYNPLNMCVVNHSLYILTPQYYVYKINADEWTFAIPYTTDKKIETPQIIRKGETKMWGISGNQLYLADLVNLPDTVWYRENALPFEVTDFSLLNDSVAILWDGVEDNYLYSLKEHSAEKYYPQLPVSEFLTSPVSSLSIVAGSQGCYHFFRQRVAYNKIDDSHLKTDAFFEEDYYYVKEEYAYYNLINRDSLNFILQSINEDPKVMPSLQDFNITEIDKQHYFALVDTMLQKPIYKNKRVDTQRIKDFYYSVVSKLDTLDERVLCKVLQQREKGWSTTTNRFVVTMINENRDTLIFSKNYCMMTLPWHLPWTVSYNGLNFISYNLKFSQLVNASVPEYFFNKSVFDNAKLIMDIADYLWQLKINY